MNETTRKLWKTVLQLTVIIEGKKFGKVITEQEVKDICVKAWESVDCTLKSSEWNQLLQIGKEVCNEIKL